MQVKVPTSYMPSNGMTQVKASSTWKFILRSCRSAKENKTNIVRAHTHRNVSHTHSMHGSTPSPTEREWNKKLTSLRTMMRVKLSAQTIYISMGWHCRLSALAQVFAQDTQREEKRRKKWILVRYMVPIHIEHAEHKYLHLYGTYILCREM